MKGFLKKRIFAFKYAFDGIIACTRLEASMKIHWLSVLAVVTLGLFCKVSGTEWCIVLLCCGLVLAAELINTAVEKLCDAILPAENAKVKFVKDAAAAAVLVAALIAVAIAIIVFLPYLLKLANKTPA